MNDYERGRWDMFSDITTAYYWKNWYFLQDDGTVYSRGSGLYMSLEEAYKEFMMDIATDGPGFYE